MLEIFKTLARSVFGMNHVANHENQYLEIVGNGLDAEHPRNARTLDIAGNEVLAGRLTVGAQPEGDNDVATKKYVDDNAGDELPAVTATDNGDVLTVVEGAWAKAAPSSGGGLSPHIHFSYDDGAYTAESDVLFADLIADWDSTNWKFNTYDLVYATDDYGIAVKCEVVGGAIVATCLNPDTSGVGSTFNLYAVRYTWNGTAVTRDEFSLSVT